MSWQILIWNIFLWTFAGVMIHLTQSSLWWLMLPATFTTWQNAADLIKAQESKEEMSDEEQLRMIRDIAKKHNIRL